MTTVYEQPTGIWHALVDGHELRQHCFTRESALVRADVFEQPIHETDIDTTTELWDELADAEEEAAYWDEVRDCCGGRNYWCIHFRQYPPAGASDD